MMLKLGQLPDRQHVKLTITLSAELRKALDDYAALYARSYGAEEPVAELVPFMIESFLEGDAGFKKARKELEGEPMPLPLPKRKLKARRPGSDASEEDQS
jgi:hypothetical protein